MATIKAGIANIDQKIETWKRNLLDLTLRNRQLCYHPAAKNSIEIVHPEIDSLFNSFTIAGKTHTFIPVYKSPERRENKRKTTREEESEEAEEIISVKEPGEPSTNMEESQEQQVVGPLPTNRAEENGEPERVDQENGINGELEAGDAEINGAVAIVDENYRIAFERAIETAKDTELVTKHDDENLRRILKRRFQRARETMEEQGINTLYMTFGLLKWFEQKAVDPVYTPLLFVPARLSQKTVKSSFTIMLEDDEVILNPAIVEKFRRDFNLTMPEFPDEFDETALQTFLNNVRAILPPGSGWEVQARVHLGNFSFAKLTLYADIARHPELIARHKVISAIAKNGGYIELAEHVPAANELGDSVEPAKNCSILDSDSSQDTAIQYAKKGASLVIHGPPGTGKSQCITNIIAECLALGKKVLFVAEKNAALEVVKKRLDQHGVGEFCLEIHSHKANKNDVLHQIEHSLNAQLTPQGVDLANYEKLKILRKQLNDYIRTLHTPLGATKQSIYQKLGELSKLKDIPTLDGTFVDPIALTQEEIYAMRDSFARLAKYETAIEHIAENPWKNCKSKRLQGMTKEDLGTQLRSLIDLTTEFNGTLQGFQEAYNLLPIRTVPDIEKYQEFLSRYNHLALEMDIKEYMRRYEAEFSSIFRVFKSSYRSFRNEVQRCFSASQKLPLLEHLKKMQRFQETCLGTPRKGEYRGIDVEFLKLWANWRQIAKAEKYLKDIIDSPVPIQISKQQEDATDWIKIRIFALYWMHFLPEFDVWTAVQFLRDKLKKCGLTNFIESIVDHPLPKIPLEDVFYKKYLEQWLTQACLKFPSILTDFNVQYHLRNISAFRLLDKTCLKINEYRLCEKIFQMRPKGASLLADAKTLEENILQRELHKKRNIMPLRKLFSQTMTFVTSIKPCFMMSPLSVANFLPIEDFVQYFDLVVFDEASQICPEDAIGAIARGKQLIVVGDEHQLPPTRFFNASMGDGTYADGDDSDSFDSILDQCCTIGMPEVMLNWHYRSRKEGLIAYSNRQFYDNRLDTFPDLLRTGTTNASTVDQLPAIEFHHVINGIYDTGKTRKNRIEARVVAKAIVRHYQNNVENKTNFTLGIVTFSQAQQEAVEEELEALYKEDPACETLIKSFADEPLFIKNIENVQGDERDFIFFSVGYGRSLSGRLILNFGPLNKVGGERRLNVAITRARYHVKIYCSFLPGEVDRKRITSTGTQMLFGYLEYAKSGKLFDPTRVSGIIQQKFDSDLEKGVCSALEQLGYAVDTEVGCSGYHIDLAIINPQDPSRYLLGIESDGPSYYASKTARDRDRLRHEVLEGLGWHLYHVWSLHWLSKREEVINEIQELIRQLLAGTTLPRTEGSPKPKGKEKAIPTVEIVTKSVEEVKLSAAEKMDPRFRNQLFDEFPWIQGYTQYRGEGRFTPEDFAEKPKLVQKITREIVNKEGPIHRDLLVKRLLAVFTIPKRIPRITKILDETLPPDQEFFYPPEWDDTLVRICANTKEDPRKFAQISDLEIKACMFHLLKHAVRLNRKDLYLQVVKVFGFSNVQEGYLVQLDRVLKDLSDANKISIHEEEVKIIG